MEPTPSRKSASASCGPPWHVINAAGMHDQITFVTSRGRRVAAVVSVAVAEGAAEDGKAADDAATATIYAVNVQLLEDRGGTPSLTMAEIFEQYATDLLREFGHDPNRSRPPPGRTPLARPTRSGTRCYGGRPRSPSSCASGPPDHSADSARVLPARKPGEQCYAPRGLKRNPAAACR